MVNIPMGNKVQRKEHIFKIPHYDPQALFLVFLVFKQSSQ